MSNPVKVVLRPIYYFSIGVDYCISAIFELYFLLYLVTFLSWDEFGVGSLLTSVVQKGFHVLVTA